MRLWGLFCLCPFLTGSRKSRDSPPSRGEGGREERGRRNQPIAARFCVGQWETTGPGLLRHMTATRRRAGGYLRRGGGLLRAVRAAGGLRAVLVRAGRRARRGSPGERVCSTTGRTKGSPALPPLHLQLGRTRRGRRTRLLLGYTLSRASPQHCSVALLPSPGPGMATVTHTQQKTLLKKGNKSPLLFFLFVNDTFFIVLNTRLSLIHPHRSHSLPAHPELPVPDATARTVRSHRPAQIPEQPAAPSASSPQREYSTAIVLNGGKQTATEFSEHLPVQVLYCQKKLQARNVALSETRSGRQCL